MKVAVVGGGVAGAVAAAEMHRLGVEVTLFEARSEVGGSASTVIAEGYVFEPGADAMPRPHPAIDHLVDHHGLDVVPARSADRRWLATGEGLMTLPMSPGAIVASSLVSARGKLRAASEVGVTSSSADGESVLGFMQRRFGTEAGWLVAHVMATEVFAGDPADLGVEAAFPDLVEMERSSGSVLRALLERRRSAEDENALPPGTWVPAVGMRHMVEDLLHPLEDRIVTGFEVEEVTIDRGGWRVAGPETVTFDGVVLAIDPAVAARIGPERLRPVLAHRPCVPVTVVGLGGAEEGLPLPPGLGAVVHPEAGMWTAAVRFESSYTWTRAPAGSALAKIVLPGDEPLSWTDDYVGRVAGTELSEMLGTTVSASWRRVVRFRPGIPQYRAGHLPWLERVDAVVDSMPGLSLTGWGYRGAGVAEVATDALRIAGEMAR